MKEPGRGGLREGRELRLPTQMAQGGRKGKVQTLAGLRDYSGAYALLSTCAGMEDPSCVGT